MTGKLQRSFVWGSFVTEKPFPGDLDVFLLMQAGFDQEFSTLPPEQRDLFDHGRRDCCLRLMSSGQLKPSVRKNWHPG
jgi:hypothetical protein